VIESDRAGERGQAEPGDEGTNSLRDLQDGHV
jgi:hypothetical protein